MTSAIPSGTAKPNEQLIQEKPLSFDEFLARCGGDNRYELIDGEVFDLELTGVLQIDLNPLRVEWQSRREFEQRSLLAQFC
jgi:Uma2 family endonuclease